MAYYLVPRHCDFPNNNIFFHLDSNTWMSRKGVSKTEAYKVYQVGRVFCSWLHTVDIGLFQMSGIISEDRYLIHYQ